MTNGADKQIDYGPNQGKILLVGDIKRAFLNINALNGSRYEVCADADEAINAVARKRFAAIAIVLSGISTNLSVTLKKMRDCSNTRIINSTDNGAKLVEDYLICPVEPDAFYESVTSLSKPLLRPRLEPELYQQTEIQLPDLVETTIEARIRHLERLATEDDLTGLKNRRYIREFTRQIIERSGREGGQVTLLVFDIDNFKRYNDLYGHATGDEILRQAAVLVRHCCRSHDIVGRIGGDEFAVVFWDEPRPTPPDTPDGTSERRSASADHPTEVLAIAQRFIKEIEKAELSSLDGLGPEGKGVLTISGGLATFPRDGQTTQELFLQADKALLEAKRSGKNRIYLVGKPDNDIANIQ
jgi:PleD family two-component response regulator